MHDAHLSSIAAGPARAGVSRRTLLATGLAALSAGALANCGGTGSPTSSPASGDPSGGAGSESGGVPTRIPFTGVTPDLPGANPNAIDAYLSFPSERVSILPEKLGITEPVSILAPLSIYVPPALPQNQFWQNLNEQLGVTLDYTMVPGADYVTRFQATVAGDSLPELVRVPSVPALDQLLEAKFADLSDHLAGDAAKDYPMLANLPTDTWRGAMFDGAIRGVPMHLLPLANRVEVRLDVVERLGLGVDFTDAEGFLTFCREVTDPKAKRWAMVAPYPANFTRQICGVPNTWAVEGGKFTHEVETEQYKRWLDLSARMWGEGLFHPQSLNNPQVALLFQSEQFMLFEVGGPGFAGAMPIYTKVAPELRVKPVVPPSYDGGGAAPVYVGRGNNGITAIRKDLSPDRIKDLLRTLNALAAPFGTREWLHVQYGKEGVNYTWQEGVGPKLTESGTKEKIVANYTPGSPMVMFSPGYEDVVRAEHQYETTVGPTALPHPTAGLYSAEDSSTGARLDLKIKNETLDIITGRKPLSGWDAVVSDWRSSGGDKIRTEYEAALSRRDG